jgi:outer membrane protein OmpA-like peptidoglycan-associated protein
MVGILLACLLLAPPLQAQTTDKWYAKGIKAFSEHDYPKAIDYFQWSIAHGGGWQPRWALANCWRESMNYAEAGRCYAQVIDEPALPAVTYFHYAQTLMAARRYAEAEKWFAKYGEIAANDPSATAFRGLDKLVSACLGDSMLYAIERLSINSNSSDFAPYCYQGGLLFVSGRANDLGVQRVSTLDNAQLLDIYFSAPDSNGRWSRPKLRSALNTKLNEGPISIDTASGVLFITRNDLAYRKNRDKAAGRGLNRLRIETMTLVNGDWQAAGNMPFNDPRYAVGHPAIGLGGKALFFASDMPGGWGGTDLYRSEWTSAGWGPPINLGSGINTSQDDLFPFVDDKGGLYFSSNGHVGLGGLDLFYAQPMGNGQWARVQNLGYPLNSEADDFGIVTTPEGDLGYFASNRGNAPENDDIFAFRRDWPRFECQPMLSNNYCFFYSDEAVLDIDTLPFAYEWDFGDGKKARGLEARHCYDGPGRYDIALNIIDTVLNKIFLNQHDYLLVVQDTEQVTITAPDTVALGTTVSFSASKSILEGCQLAQFYWEYGDGMRDRGMEVSHAYATLGTYEVRLGATGMPSEDGALLCKNCVTKQVTVVAPAQLEAMHARQAAAKELEAMAQRTFNDWKPTAGGQPSKPISAGDSVKYSLQLLESKSPIDIRKAPFDGMDDLREIRTVDGFAVHQGLSDNLGDLHPIYRKAKHLGFEDAIVVVVTDPQDLQKLQPQSIHLPTKLTDEGYVIFLGDIKDYEENPMEAEISIEDFEQGTVKFQKMTDSLGRFEIKIPNGKIYTWTVAVDDFLPATGYLDLAGSTYNPMGRVTLREHITLRQVEELAASGDVFRINNILFDFDSDKLRPESVKQIQKLAAILIEYPDFALEVQAHTDDVGDDAYNLDLSRRRAYSVLKYMIASGYEIGHITSNGYGETAPLVPNDSPAHRQFNRRVEFKFSPIAH